MAKVAMVSALEGTTEAIKTATYTEFAKARAYLPGPKKKQNPGSQCTADQMGK